MRSGVWGIVVAGCAAAMVTACAAQRAAQMGVGELALGRSVFDETCAVCHSIVPPARMAPPMSHIARHYLEATPDTAAALHRIEQWIGKPSTDASLLPARAVEQFGLMPPLQLSSERRRAVAGYVLSLAGGAGAEHEPGTPGRGMQRRMQHGVQDTARGMGMQHRHGQAGAMAQETEAAVVRMGEAAASALRTGLSGRLGAALQAGPPERAIDVCAIEALPLTDSIARAAGAGVTLKRTSTRIRNPLNAPDPLEERALAWFDAEQRAGRSPAQLVQADGASGYRYYAPLRIAAPCLSCHGPAESLAPAVRAALQQRYPADRATGYAEGELRGLIRVTVPTALLAPAR